MDLKSLSFNLDSLEVKTPQGYFEKKEWVSNSDLSRLSAMERGANYTEPSRAIFEFGSAFDAMITEPEKYKPEDYNLQPHHFEQMEKIKELISISFSELTYQVEYYKEFATPHGTVQAKCKTDIEYNGYSKFNC